MPQVTKPSSINIIDTQQIFGVLEYLKQQGKPAVFNYKELLDLLSEVRRNRRYREPDATFAAVSRDFRSQPQERFVEALKRLQITVGSYDFRACSVSPGEKTSALEGHNQIQTLTAPISYLLGLLADRKDPEVVIISGSFDLFYPLIDFVTARKGKATLLFFRNFFDSRWMQKWEDFPGLFNPDCPIGWGELDANSERLLGISLAAGTPKSDGGLSAF